MPKTGKNPEILTVPQVLQKLWIFCLFLLGRPALLSCIEVIL